MMCDLEPAEIRKGKEFVVEIARPGPAGQTAAARLGLPAYWGQLEDALARARVTDDRVIYTVDVQEARMERLLDHMPENANLDEVNYLAQRLALLDEDAYRLYEGMVCIEETYGPTAEIPIPRLIDMADSKNIRLLDIIPVDNDAALGVYACNHGRLAEMRAMPPAKNGYFDYERMGRELRLKERGMYLPGVGYLRMSADMNQNYSPDNLPRPQKPNWVFSLDIAIPRYATVHLELPDHTEHFDKVAQMVRERGCAVPHFDSILPMLSGWFGCDDDLSEFNELADAIRVLDGKGELPKYRVLVETFLYPDVPHDINEVSWDAAEAIELAQHLDEYTLMAEPLLPEELAAERLRNEYQIGKDHLLFPYTEQEVQTVLERLGAASLDECLIFHAESAWASSLEGLIQPDSDPELLQTLSVRLTEVKVQGKLGKYNAALNFTDCSGLDYAVDLCKNLGCFWVNAEFFSPAHYARLVLALAHGLTDPKFYENVNLNAYGCALMEADRVSSTPYGYMQYSDRVFQYEYARGPRQGMSVLQQ